MRGLIWGTDGIGATGRRSVRPAKVDFYNESELVRRPALKTDHRVAGAFPAVRPHQYFSWILLPLPLLLVAASDACLPSSF
jgi:hypothetical protein